VNCVPLTGLITELPPQNTLHLKTREKADHNNNKMRDNYAKSKRVDAAVAAIQRGEFVHFSDAAKKYECSREAVSRRVRGLTKSKKQAYSFWRQCLTDEEEEVLIQRINDLTDRAMPPTSQIVKNLAEEMRGARVSKNWVGGFVKRHGIRLKSLYLRNIDNLRASAEYAPMFQLFFSVVS
jgi:transposase